MPNTRDTDTCSHPLCMELDRLGIPRDSTWRPLILYMRSISEYEFLSEAQKVQMQSLVLATLQGKDFSRQAFNETARRIERILYAQWDERLRTAIQETVNLVEASRKLMMERRGEVQELEEGTVGNIASGENIDTIIEKVRGDFESLIKHMEEDAEQLVAMSMSDSLTGLHNRRAFDKRIVEMIEQAMYGGDPLSLLMIDIDHFKNFNDSYGHMVGDQALAAVASRIRKETASLGGEPKAFAARFGGEEFAVLLPCADIDAALDIADDLRERIANYHFVLRDPENNAVIRNDISLTVSIGVAQLDQSDISTPVKRFIHQADQALYAAKTAGRNAIRQYLPGMNGDI